MNLGTLRNDVEGGSAAVSRLQNGRYRLEFLCSTDNSKEDWYATNIDGILPEFMDAQDHFFGTGKDESWVPPPDSVYANMRCVESEYNYIPSIGEKRVQVAYETLTTSWVLEKDEDTDYELNGLKRISRQYVALPDTAYTNVVGTATITSDSTTLYLASYKIVETDAKWTLQEVWLEAGVLRVTEKNEAEGVKSVTTTFLVTEGNTVGPIVDKDTSNFEGLQTIVVKTLQDKDGNALGANGTTPVSQFDQYVDFRYPGEVSIAADSDTIGAVSPGTYISYWYSLVPPVTAQIKAKIYVFFQSSDEITDSDLVYDGALGLWNPTSWAKGIIDGLGTDFNISSVKPIAQDTVFSEYTAVTGGANIRSGIGDYADGFGAFLVEGNYICPGATWSITVSGGPDRPDGKKYVLEAPTLTPAFDDVDGNQVWKKVIIVATIPTR